MMGDAVRTLASGALYAAYLAVGVSAVVAFAIVMVVVDLVIV